MYKTCIQKQLHIVTALKNLPNSDIYKYIMGLKKKLSAFDDAHAIEENKVLSCQSETFISYTLKNGQMSFFAKSASLISSGLAYMLTYSFSEETPETILKAPLILFNELNLPQLISSSRNDGAIGMHTKIRQHALKEIMISQKI